MPSPYRYDLRSRVVAVVEQGMEVKEASRIFGLPRDTLTAWRARKEATGAGQAKVGYPQGHSHKITDPEQFKAFVDAREDAPVEELAEAGGGVKRRTIWRQLRKLGDTHKKSPSIIPSETKD